mmetsp:Transcript_34035/g.76380  ORF Transcript_34035/g.76380 Transcript_34035/m.76380 type:complete len:308 (+) Transcript_34035:94-1017(+)
MALFSILLLVGSSAAASSTSAPELDCVNADMTLLQKGLHVKALQEPHAKPWDIHLYLVGAHHIAGGNLNRKIMKWAFDFLGANYSCQQHDYQHATITTEGGEHKCYESPGCRIHWDNSLSLPVVQEKRELAGSAGLRAVQSVRDPVMMLASAYCYHHRGEELGNPIATWPDIMQMGPLDGMKDIFPVMFLIIEQMVQIYENSEDDMYNSRLEDLMESSASFDASVKRIFDHMFGDLITSEQHEQIRELAKAEDVNRGAKNGRTAHDDNHTQSDCENVALEVLLKHAWMYEPLQKLAEHIGYAQADST